jgi:hypothetical protein
VILGVRCILLWDCFADRKYDFLSDPGQATHGTDINGRLVEDPESFEQWN